jgi:uncharacterized membrane protein YhaH (DUF805 family)
MGIWLGRAHCARRAPARNNTEDYLGWWQLLYFFPVIGWIVLILFCAERTQPNRYAQEI